MSEHPDTSAAHCMCWHHGLGDKSVSMRAETDSFLDNFLRETQAMTPEQRGHTLEHPPEERLSIDTAHEVQPANWPPAVWLALLPLRA